MANITLSLTDAGKGVLIRICSDEQLPAPDSEGGTIAQNLALIALDAVRREYERVTGKKLQKTTIC